MTVPATPVFSNKINNRSSTFFFFFYIILIFQTKQRAAAQHTINIADKRLHSLKPITPERWIFTPSVPAHLLLVWCLWNGFVNEEWLKAIFLAFHFGREKPPFAYHLTDTAQIHDYKSNKRGLYPIHGLAASYTVHYSWTKVIGLPKWIEADDGRVWCHAAKRQSLLGVVFGQSE